MMDWIEMVLRFFPGRIGILLRQYWYKLRMQECNKVSIAPGCYFHNPSSIKLEESVSIGSDSKFYADGGSIHCFHRVAFNNNVHINASVGGNIIIMENCLIGPGVVMRSSDHKFEDRTKEIMNQGHKSGDITIYADCWLGANVVVLGGGEHRQGSSDWGRSSGYY
jgi:acetyltransferase-like isoleucine patch superfamily enzyme